MAIETSGRIGSVAVGQGGELLAERHFSADKQHAGELLPTMDSLAKQFGWAPGDIDHFYVSAGPGSFTGIRIAVTAAKALAFAKATRVVAVPSLESTALNVLDAATDCQMDIQHVGVVLDAQRKHIYAAVFERFQADHNQPAQAYLPVSSTNGDARNNDFIPGFRTVVQACLTSPEELLAKIPQSPLHILGEALEWPHHKEAFTGNGLCILPRDYWHPQARHVLTCGNFRAKAGIFTPLDELTPIYLRRPTAVERWEEEHKPQ